MPSMISLLLREQIKLLKPLLSNFSVTASRGLQDALGGLGEKAVAGKTDFDCFDIGGSIPAALATPAELESGDKRVVLYLHGGGYVAGSIGYAKGFAGLLASRINARVMCVAYRLAPEHPYPAALEDAFAAYRYLMSEGFAPEDISLAGESAGGGLCFALCLKLKDEKMPMPSRIVAISPWTDMTMSGGSYNRNRKLDVSLTRKEIEGFVRACAPSDRAAPYASPLFGDLSGLPPCRIYVGGDELLTDDSVMIAKKLNKAGVPCSLTVAEGMWHAYVLYGTPEANEALAEIRDFLGMV